MKRIPLVELLADRAVVHPTRMVGASWVGDRLAITVAGHAWWRPPYGVPTEGEIRLEFGGVGECAISADGLGWYEDEVLDDFAVTPVEAVGWAQPRVWSIYCSSPIPAPLAVYLALDDFLVSAGAYRRPADYLNCAERLSSFLAMCAAGGFLLARAPDCVRDLLCAELARQGVAHDVHPTEDNDDGALLVTLGGAAFFCRSAEAVIEPAGTLGVSDRAV